MKMVKGKLFYEFYFFPTISYRDDLINAIEFRFLKWYFGFTWRER